MGGVRERTEEEGRLNDCLAQGTTTTQCMDGANLSNWMMTQCRIIIIMGLGVVYLSLL